MLWRLSWTFASGADVAWITDELHDPARISAVLVRRAQLTGSAAGMVALGALGSVVERDTAMVIAGVALLALGLYVATRFRERRFVAAPERRLAASWDVLVRGAALVRGSRAILLLFAATLAANGAALFGRLQPRRLVDLGLPTDPVAWFTALGVTALLVGAATFRLAERRLGDAAGCPAGLRGRVRGGRRRRARPGAGAGGADRECRSAARRGHRRAAH